MEIFETGELPLNPNITDKKSYGGKTILMTLIMFGETLKAKDGSPLAHKFLFNYGNGINLLQIDENGLNTLDYAVLFGDEILTKKIAQTLEPILGKKAEDIIKSSEKKIRTNSEEIKSFITGVIDNRDFIETPYEKKYKYFQELMVNCEEALTRIDRFTPLRPRETLTIQEIISKYTGKKSFRAGSQMEKVPSRPFN